MFTIIHRMILAELLRVFFMCWLGLTGMILIGGVIAEATQQGLGPMQILEVIPFLIPSTMPYTLPTTTLFATCVVYGRLAHDNEVLAIKAAGINVFQVVIPAVILGSVASLGTMALYWDLIPTTHWSLRTHFVKNLEEVMYNMLRKDGRIQHPQLDYCVYARKVEGPYLIDASFMHRDPKTRGFDWIARGQKATIKVEDDNKIIRIWMSEGTLRKENGETANFKDVVWPIEMKIPPPEKNRPTDMSWPEMGEFREKWEDEIARLKHEIAEHERVIGLGNAPPEYQEHIGHRRSQIRNYRSMIANIDAEYQMRPALALGCLCFVLVGCPVGIWFSRSDYLSSFITCFLPVIVAYYPLLLCGVNMAKSGRYHPLVAIWPANAIMAFAATVLLRKLMRN